MNPDFFRARDKQRVSLTWGNEQKPALGRRFAFGLRSSSFVVSRPLDDKWDRFDFHSQFGGTAGDAERLSSPGGSPSAQRRWQGPTRPSSLKSSRRCDQVPAGSFRAGGAGGRVSSAIGMSGVRRFRPVDATAMRWRACRLQSRVRVARSSTLCSPRLRNWSGVNRRWTPTNRTSIRRSSSASRGASPTKRTRSGERPCRWTISSTWRSLLHPGSNPAKSSKAGRSRCSLRYAPTSSRLVLLQRNRGTPASRRKARLSLTSANTGQRRSPARFLVSYSAATSRLMGWPGKSSSS